MFLIAHLDVIQGCALMHGIAPEDTQKLLDCLGAHVRSYDKGVFVLNEGDRVSGVGLVLSGSVHVLKDDFWGNRTILAGIGPGGLFAEAFACADALRLPVSVIAAEKTDLMMLDVTKLLTPCQNACAFHRALVFNLVKILANKNILLTEKIEHISRKTTREKLLSYLSAEAARKGSNKFEIPFNRQQLADFLAVERSAMSAELSRMRRDGILRYDRDQFELLRGAEG